MLTRCWSLNAQIAPKDKYVNTDKIITQFGKQTAWVADSVVAFVNRNFFNEEEKVRAYFTFIAKFIDYDVQRLNELIILPTASYNFEGPLHHSISQDPQEVFGARKGVCEGLARLLCKFCEGSGIKAEMVVGYCKTPEGEVITDLGHAWNAVKIDGQWQLADVTLSTGYMNEKHNFIKQFSGKYFLLPADSFLLDHLPMDPIWQLSRKPISKRYFFTGDSSRKFYSRKFSYPDSIQKLLSKRGFERNYQTLLNYYRFDPEDKNYARNIDIYVNNYCVNKLTVSGIYFEDFVNFYHSTLEKNNTKANCRKALKMLYDSQKALSDVDVLLKSKKPMTPEFAQVWQEMKNNIKKNNKSINNNISVVKLRQKLATQ